MSIVAGCRVLMVGLSVGRRFVSCGVVCFTVPASAN